jgi:hypothetical protein
VQFTSFCVLDLGLEESNYRKVLESNLGFTYLPLVNKKVLGSFNPALHSFAIVAMWSSVGRGGAAGWTPARRRRVSTEEGTDHEGVLT